MLASPAGLPKSRRNGMRWKYFIPSVVITALIVVFNILFLDMVLKSSIISAGEMIFGAKVEVSSVKTKFKNLSIDINGLKAADKNDVFKNIFDIGDIRFSVRFAPLLSMKLIINEMSVEGVKWGTKRETSGALPPAKQAKYVKQQKKENSNSFFSKLTDKLTEKGKSEITQLPAMGNVKSVQDQFKDFSLDKTVSAEDLQSIRELDAMQKGFGDKCASYQEQINGIDTAAKAKEASFEISDLSNIKISSPKDAEALKSKLDALNKTKDDLQKSLDQINGLKARAEADFGTDKDIAAKINDLKDKDIKALSDKYKIQSFSTGGIAKSIFGPVWMARVEKAIYYVQVVRKYMPPKKKNSNTTTVQRENGTDVRFSKQDNPPDFLISKVTLTGTTGGDGKEGVPLDFTGEINDITSDQSLLGRPTKFDVNGVQAVKTLKINGVFDHRSEEDALDTFSFVYSGLTAKEMNLPQSEYLPAFDKGEGKVNGVFTLKGDNINASIDIELTGIKLPESDKNDETKSMVASLWAGVDSISVTAKLTGTLEKIDMSVTSNIDKTLSDRLAKLYGEKIAEVQNKIRSEVDRLTNDKKAEVMSQYNSKKNELAQMFSGKQKEAQDKIDGLKKMQDSKQNEAKNLADNARKQAQIAADAEKQKLQDQADAEKKNAEDDAKKKAEDEIQKKAQEQLKGLFGK